MTKQVTVNFIIGKYKDAVLCNVVPMNASHLLLGRPWLYDLRVQHDGFLNNYSLKFSDRSIKLLPMTLEQIAHDDAVRKKEKIKENLFLTKNGLRSAVIKGM